MVDGVLIETFVDHGEGRNFDWNSQRSCDVRELVS